VFPLEGRASVTFDAAFALVDAAMYHSKAKGRACATRIESVDPKLPLEQAALASGLSDRAILEVHRPAEDFAPA